MHDDGNRDEVLRRLERWRANRDPEALGYLLKWQRDRAYATALRILRHSADAEDAVQHSFIKLMSRTQGFENPETFKLAVYRAVVQCALDMARANRVRSNLEKAMIPLERTHSIPQLAAEQAEALQQVWSELNAMPEESRALVVLCYQEGLSVSDAAEVLNVPRETLRDRLAAAMTELRQKLNQRGMKVSLLLLVTLLNPLASGSVLAAPASLCEALDTVLSGPPCAEIAAAKAAPLSAKLASAGASSATVGFPAAMALGAAASLFIVAGSWFMLESNSRTKLSRQYKTNAFVPVLPAAGVEKQLAVNRDAPAEQKIQPPVAAADAQVPAPAKAGAAGRAVAGKREAGEKDEPIALDRLPDVVRDAALKAKKGMVLIEAERITENNTVTYEVDGTANGQKFEILVSSAGKVLSVTLDEDDEADKKGAAIKPPAPPKADF